MHWVADLATSEPAQAPVVREGSPDPKEVREFFELYKEHSTLTRSGVAAARAGRGRGDRRTGTYTHTSEELTVGARLAWRHNTRCIGKLYWRGLTVRDFARHHRRRGSPRAASITASSSSTRAASSRRSRSSRPTRPGERAAQVRNGQLMSYAGHRQADGTVIGDRDTVAMTELAKAHGWAPASGGPVRHPAARHGGPATATSASHEIPRRARPRGRDRAPHDRRAWPSSACAGGAFRRSATMTLSIGGINYPCAPFTGWYLAPETRPATSRIPTATTCCRRSPRRSGSTLRPALAVEGQGHDRAHGRVLHSFDKAGMRMDDHHTAARSSTSGRSPRSARAARSRPNGPGWSRRSPPRCPRTSTASSRTSSSCRR